MPVVVLEAGQLYLLYGALALDQTLRIAHRLGLARRGQRALGSYGPDMCMILRNGADSIASRRWRLLASFSYLSRMETKTRRVWSISPSYMTDGSEKGPSVGIVVGIIEVA